MQINENQHYLTVHLRIFNWEDNHLKSVNIFVPRIWTPPVKQVLPVSRIRRVHIFGNG